MTLGRRKSLDDGKWHGIDGLSHRDEIQTTEKVPTLHLTEAYVRSIVLNMDLIGKIKRALIYTLTGKLDLSYRVFLRGWTARYAGELR